MNKTILTLCDHVRDTTLWNLNIYLEDRENLPALVRPVTEGLRAARREKEDRVRQKEDARRKREEEARQKAAKGRLNPADMFKPPLRDEFAEWDDAGLPIRMKNGDAVPASKLKKLKKEWDRQKVAHDAFVAAGGAGSSTSVVDGSGGAAVSQQVVTEGSGNGSGSGA